MYVKKEEVQHLANALDLYLDAAQEGLLDVRLKEFQTMNALRARCDEKVEQEPPK